MATATQESTGATNWSVIAAGESLTAALKSDGTLWAWGYNSSGILGTGDAWKEVPGQIGTVTDWTAAFTLASGDTEGAVAYTIDFSDTAGNAGTQVTSTTDGTSVTVDKTAPTLLSVAIDSGNATSVAKVGDTVTLSFTANETIASPMLAFSIGGASATGLVTVTNASGNEWTAAFTLASGDTEGAA